MNPDLNDIWLGVLRELRQAVSPSTFEIWLAPLRPRGYEDCTLILEAPSEIRTWVADRFGRLLGSCAQSVLGPETQVDVVSAQATSVASGLGADGLAGGRDQDVAVSFNPKLSFEQFVIGDSNRLAHAAALAVAEMPAQAYNPLFIYGPPGLGKTHLLHSIANYVTAHGNGMSVRYTTVESFTNEFVSALQSGSVEAFKSRFRRNDVLLIDDVQFLERKARTEEEFFHTFNALYDVGGQIVVTSDRLPSDLGALEDRLRERFESGLVTDIRPPGTELRMTILRKRIQHDGLGDIDPRALEVIADRIRHNIRALEGALIRIVAFASLTNRPITADLAAEVLDGLYPRRATRDDEMTIAEILDATCRQFGVTREEMVGAGRSARVVWPRQVAMYLARELTQQSLPTIGRAFGGRDHTTVLHAHRRATKRIGTDPQALETVHSLTDRLTGPHS